MSQDTATTTERDSDLRTEADNTARPDQASDLGRDYYWIEVER